MNTRKMSFSLTIVLLLVLSACAAQNAGSENSAVQQFTLPPLESAAPLPTDTPMPMEESDSGDDPAAETALPVDELEQSVLFTAPVTARGTVLILTGHVLDINGNPLEGAAIEIWQTDASGVYDHPGDPGTANRDRGFQFYGTAVADAQGKYAFRTIRPGEYEPRPPHIHFKVWLNSTLLLTSQLYFTDTGNDGGLGAGADQLLVALEPDGEIYRGMFDIVVDTGIGAGSLPLTPSQAEGPYYPVVTVADFDNDLASVED